jgi:prepilin signal peptidase PulO-like enzyme (type II secretory pathway)
MFLRGWDFLFYLLFGVLITQCVSVLGVLPVFAYLVIPAVAAAFLFQTVRARLIFGWVFAGAVSLVGLETARVSQLDPGPTIVCLFAAALVVLGVGLFLRAHRFAPRMLGRVAGFGVLFAVFLGGTLMFRKSSPTDELATAIGFARTGDPTKQRQALASFRRFPDAQARWLPLVVPMLQDADRVARGAAVGLLGDVHARGAVAALAARLAVETDEEVRESVIRALRAIGDPGAVRALADAAAREQEPDLVVALGVAAFELAGPGQDADLRRVADALVKVIADGDAPRAARRDAGDALRAHVEIDPVSLDDPAAAAWWHDHRDHLVWQAPRHRFAAPASGG